MHRAPRYVQVYNQILSMIQGANFAPGSKLPSEEAMTKDFDVSRVTLRTALSLLKEDGVIKSIHGQGHFIADEQTSKNQGIEALESPLRKCMSLPLTEGEAYYHLNKASEFTDHLFNVSEKQYLTLNLWYQFENKNVANELSIVLPKVIEQFKIDLNSEKQVTEFLEKDLYEITASSELTIALSDRSATTFKRSFLAADPLTLLTEDLFAIDGSRIAQNKFYVPSKYFRAHIHRFTNQSTQFKTIK